MSLAPASYYNPTAAFNPFGPGATLGSDQIFDRTSPVPPAAMVADGTIHAPQGRVPTNISSLAPPRSDSRPESRPDFTRGFGLDIAEEEEPAEEEIPTGSEIMDVVEPDKEFLHMDAGLGEEQDGVSTVAASRIHSRHVSKISAPLSLHSVGGTELGGSPAEVVPSREAVGDVIIEDLDDAAVAEP